MRSTKIKEWGKLVTMVGSGQVLIQGIGLISGIIIIRLLSTKEYALYTLANTMLGTMTVLADGGISSGVMAQGGKVWQDKQKLGAVINTGLELRRKFSVFSLLVSMPVLFYLLMYHGANIWFSILIILSIIPAFFAAVSDTVLEVPAKLHQDIGKLQKNQIATGIGRFILIISSLLLFPFTFVAVLGNGLPRMIANIKLKKISNEYADPHEPADPLIKKEILQVVKRTLPGAIYFCLASQISIWLISIFGSTTAIAHIGALSRLTTFLTLFSTVFSVLAVPRFARLPENKKLLTKRFIQIQVCIFIVVFSIIGTVYLIPSQILWILGKGYSGLTTEVLLITIANCIGMMGGITYYVLLSRGWIIKPVLYISINVISQATLACIMNLSTTKNILLFSIADTTLGFSILIIYFIYRITKLKNPPEASLEVVADAI